MDKACKSNAGSWTLETRNWKRYNAYMKNFQDLDVYTRASKLFPVVYKIVRSWKIVDQRELGSQIIRASNSIHANIAEGYGKSSQDFKRYLGMAIGSCDEVRSHIKDSFNVGLVGKDVYEHLINEYEIVGKQLMRLKQNWK